MQPDAADTSHTLRLVTAMFGLNLVGMLSGTNRTCLQLHEPRASNYHRKMKPTRYNPQLAKSRSRYKRLARSIEALEIALQAWQTALFVQLSGGRRIGMGAAFDGATLRRLIAVLGEV
jgi:hypothetical protein